MRVDEVKAQGGMNVSREITHNCSKENLITGCKTRAVYGRGGGQKEVHQGNKGIKPEFKIMEGNFSSCYLNLFFPFKHIKVLKVFSDMLYPSFWISFKQCNFLNMFRSFGTF